MRLKVKAKLSANGETKKYQNARLYYKIVFTGGGATEELPAAGIDPDTGYYQAAPQDTVLGKLVRYASTRFPDGSQQGVPNLAVALKSKVKLWNEPGSAVWEGLPDKTISFVVWNRALQTATQIEANRMPGSEWGWADASQTNVSGSRAKLNSAGVSGLNHHVDPADQDTDGNPATAPEAEQSEAQIAARLKIATVLVAFTHGVPEPAFFDK